MIQVLPVVDQYSVFDEVKYVVKVGKVSDVDNLPPGQIKREKTDLNILLFKELLRMRLSKGTE